MVRTVNEAAHAQRRSAILDAAEQAIATRGYEQMAISDILSERGISSGAFYHYYDSKSVLLLALVERMGDEIEQLVLPVVHDPTPGALDKLKRIVLASTDALERLLGAPSGCLQSATREGLAQWFATPTAS